MPMNPDQNTPLASDLDTAAGLIALARNARMLGHSSSRHVRLVLTDTAARLEKLAADITDQR